MSEHLTQCPNCQTSFRVTDKQLTAAKGVVRCGSCLEVFSASVNFIRLKDQQPASAATRQQYDDDIAFGDMNLDDDYDERFGEDSDSPATEETDDIRSALREAEDLMEEVSSTPVVSDPDYETYEEYQDAPDLFVILPDEDDIAEADSPVSDEHGQDENKETDEHPEEVEEYAEPDEDDLADEDRQAGESSQEEFHPDHEFLSDDEEDEDYLDNTLTDYADDDDYAKAGSEAYFDEAEADEQEALVSESEEILQEFQQDLDDDDTENDGALNQAAAGKPHWLMQEDVKGQDKAILHDYLATLQDHEEETLQPLSGADLEDLDQDPVTIAASHKTHSLVINSALALFSLTLLFTLVLQFVDQHLEALLQRNSFARYQPLFCSILECPENAGPGNSTQLYSQELLIRTHPRIADALELSFIFHNDAATAQAFPGLELTFRDVDNTLLSNRLFLPQEYLPAELQTLGEMPARSSIQVILELNDPGGNAVNYTIAFRDI